MGQATPETTTADAATEPAERPVHAIRSPALLALVPGAVGLLLSLALYDGVLLSTTPTNPVTWVELFVFQPFLLSVAFAGAGAGIWALAE